MTSRPELVWIRDATRLGDSPDRILRASRQGELQRIQPGVYMLAAQWRTLSAEGQLRARVYAANGRLRARPTFSHESAAVILGIPLLGALPQRPHIISTSPASRTSRPIVRTHRDLDLARTLVTDGIRTTDLLTTAVDVASTRTPLGAVVALSAIRRQGVALAEIEDHLTACGAFRGARMVRLALVTSSDRCESPLEAVVLARIEDLGFARPEQQVRIQTAIGSFPVDYSWDDGHIVLEADGYAKYTDPAMLGNRTPSEAVIAEKRREDAIRAAVRTFRRVTWAEAMSGDALERTLRGLGVPRIRPARALRP